VEHRADLLGLSGLITPSLDEMVTVAQKMQERGLKVPLLIGGATTSKMHTAVKIAPTYEGTTVYVLDASRAVPVAQALVDKDLANRDTYAEDIREQYEELRTEFYAGLENRKYLDMSAARKRRLQLDFTSAEHAPPVPVRLVGGTRVVQYTIEELIDYIDWNPFFSVWQLRGRYPNRGYPRIFQDQTVGSEAKKLWDEAMAMVQEFARDKSLDMRGILGIYPANAVGDDIVVYHDDETRAQQRCVFHGLRQQAEVESDTDPYLCLSDFIAPRASGVKDYVGMFVVSAGFGLDKVVAKCKEDQDDYRYIMAEAVADRLAEAMAEKLHEDCRRSDWGYAPGERLSTEELLKVKYQGIRPAPGYPSQPDHTEKKTMWQLMDVEQEIGVELTESLAMLPAASVSGLIFAGKGSQYFAVGKITKDQVSEYAKRKDAKVEEMEKWLRPSLNYEP
jgi:5-methyltetrahydrofolate--homocysteine methyltransferase